MVMSGGRKAAEANRQIGVNPTGTSLFATNVDRRETPRARIWHKT